MQDEEFRRRKVAQVEESLKWLCAPEADQRYEMLADLDRVRMMKFVATHLASMDVNMQAEFSVCWLNTLANGLRKRAMAEELFNNLSRVLYAGAEMEKWAETRLINKNMKIAPREMAREYALITKQDARMAGLYVRDMQRIKHRVEQRVAKTGSPERKEGYEYMTQRPRYKRTKRQSDKYNKLMAERKARKLT